MKPFFDSDEKLAALVEDAASWMDTPWVANSQAKGFGVSCHNLPRALFMKAGVFAPDFPEVFGNPSQSKHEKVSRMAVLLDARPELFRIDLTTERILPGDLLGLRIYSCVDHLGVALPCNEFIHVLMHKKTDIDQYNVPPWSQRVEACWRPIK